MADPPRYSIAGKRTAARRLKQSPVAPKNSEDTRQRPLRLRDFMTVQDDWGRDRRPPPGWYPDPAGGSGSRWWDGVHWTDHTYPPPAPHWAPYAPQARPAPDPKGDRLAGLARVAIVAWAATTGTSAALLLGDAGRIHRAISAYADALRLASDTGRTAPSFASFYHLPPITVPVELLVIAFQIGIAVWQHHAAGRAASLGYPARLSPGLGAWSWFIPVGNLWMPYWALRDCLPPGHPGRQLALHAYLAWLGYILLTTITILVAIAATTSATAVLATVTLACGAYAAYAMTRLVTTIQRQHTTG